MLHRFRHCAVAGLGLTAWLSFAAAAGAQTTRQIQVEPQSQDAPPAVAPPAVAAPAPAAPPATAAPTVAAPAPADSPAAAAPAPADSPPGAAPAPTAAAPAPTPAQACAAHKFIEPEDMVAQIAADLDRVKTRAKGTRYLTLTHLANVCVPDNVLEIYRQGAIKLINSLGRTSDVVHFDPIDADRTILRINIDDLGWDAADWDNLLAVYPYAAQPNTKLFGVLQTATGTKLPYVRADWFAFTASRPPIYNALLKLPKTFAAFAREQGVDVDTDIKRFIAQRVGFQKSGEGPNNRLIERHPSRSGYFWTTYDFGGNRGKKSVFEFPLGPGGANGFEHDGSETAFSLPNGFQGYFVATSKGDTVDTVPSTIASDPKRRNSAMMNGISCMGCHADGVRPVADEVRGNVVGARGFSREVRDAVEALYPPKDRMDAMFGDDAARFAAAMARAGLDPALKLDDVEPITALSNLFEGFLDTKLAAAELGLTAADFVSSVNDNSAKLRPMLTRLAQGTVSREEFEGRFAEMIAALTDEQMIKFDKPKAVVAPAKPSAAAPAAAPYQAPAAAPYQAPAAAPYQAPRGRTPNYYR